MSRSCLIGAALALALGSAPTLASAASSSRTLVLKRSRDGHVLRLRPFRAVGRLDRASWARLNRFLGTRAGAWRTMHPRLIAVLSQLQRHFGGATLLVTSAFRAQDRWQQNSYHQVGRAVDLRVHGVPARTVLAYCLRLPKLGCGFYPNGSHVHIDVRSRAALWVDVSGPSDPPRYSRHPRRWLETH